MAAVRFPPLPPVLRALVAQAMALALLVALARLGLRLHPTAWVLLQGAGAAGASRLLGLGPRWALAQALLPLLGRAGWVLGIPAWVHLGLFALLALVYGGGLWTRVPLYHASRDAWRHLEAQLPARPGLRFVDLGCGFGGALAHLARARPEGRFLGVEASPLPWLVAWLRCLPLPNASVRLGSLWRVDLAGMDAAYAFLSPVPMPALWAKVQREMAPGSRFISHSFEVPGARPARVVPVAGRDGARLLVYDR